MINHVRALRKAKGMTQAALADAMGVSRNTINSIEVGHYVPSLPLALSLARYFGKCVEECSMTGTNRAPHHRPSGDR